MIKPFLRWAGGKQNLVSELLKHAPSHELIQKYYEPFLGAGSLFFANGFDNAYISDTNSQLINTYLSIKNDYRKVYSLIKLYETKFLKDESFYYRVRSEFNRNIEEKTQIQAARFIFLLHSNFNGIYRVNKKGVYNVPIGKRKPSLPSLDHLLEVSNKLKGKVIKEIDYSTIINKVQKNDFVYLDPPYPPIDWDKQLQQFTVNKFKEQDQIELALFANNLRDRGCFVMISNSDTPFIRDIYSGWNIHVIETTRSISCLKQRKKINELIIKNY
jgi:DNA adenine methylase